MLIVEKLVLPLAGRVGGLRVDLAIDEGDQVGRGKAAGDVRDAEIGDGLTALGVVAGETPDDRATPIVADPDGTVAAEMREQVEHVVNAVFERVVGLGAVVGGPAIAAHVWGDAAEAQGGKAPELVAPAMRELRPAMDEDDQLAGFGATGQIEAGVAGSFREVLGHREKHGGGFPSHRRRGRRLRAVPLRRMRLRWASARRHAASRRHMLAWPSQMQRPRNFALEID